MTAFAPKTWHRKDATNKQTYLISTRNEYLNEDWINTAFDSSDMHWAKPLPLDSLKIMLENGLNFGLYVTAPPPSSDPNDKPAIYSELRQIGFARFVTDYVTFAYLTDVYVEHEFRGKGLATWLVKCCGEALDILRARNGSGFRTTLLLTSNFQWAVPTYEKLLGMFVPEQKKGDGGKPVIMASGFKNKALQE